MEPATNSAVRSRSARGRGPPQAAKVSAPRAATKGGVSSRAGPARSRLRYIRDGHAPSGRMAASRRPSPRSTAARAAASSRGGRGETDASRTASGIPFDAGTGMAAGIYWPADRLSGTARTPPTGRRAEERRALFYHKVFREEAVARRARPEPLDARLQVTAPHEWMVLAGIGLSLLLFLVWAAFGSVERRLSVEAVLVRPGERHAVTSPVSGTVVETAAAVGDAPRGGADDRPRPPAGGGAPGPGRAADRGRGRGRDAALRRRRRRAPGGAAGGGAARARRGRTPGRGVDRRAARGRAPGAPAWFRAGRSARGKRSPGSATGPKTPGRRWPSPRRATPRGWPRAWTRRC